MSKRYTAILFPLALLLAACGNQAAPNTSESAAASPTVEASAAATSATPSEATSEAASVSSTTTATAQAGYPVTIDNCGLTITYEKAPEKAITMNQGATEVMLALGLEDKMVGTAYLDDTEIATKFKAAYDQVPVLAEKYPTLEQFLAAEPDFSYASYESAFSEKRTKERPDLQADGINTYVSDFGCAHNEAEAASWDRLYNQVTDIAKIFGTVDKAQTLIADQKATVERISQEKVGKGAKAVWWDSGIKEAPFVAGGTGGPQMIMDAVGLDNPFKDTKDNWFDGTWETFIAADPDWIILADASWDSAQGKIDHAKNDPALKELKAVKEDKFLILPFSQTTPGITLVDGLVSLDNQLTGKP